MLYILHINNHKIIIVIIQSKLIRIIKTPVGLFEIIARLLLKDTLSKEISKEHVYCAFRKVREVSKDNFRELRLRLD